MIKWLWFTNFIIPVHMHVWHCFFPKSGVNMISPQLYMHDRICFQTRPKSWDHEHQRQLGPILPVEDSAAKCRVGDVDRKWSLLANLWPFKMLQESTTIWFLTSVFWFYILLVFPQDGKIEMHDQQNSQTHRSHDLLQTMRMHTLVSQYFLPYASTISRSWTAYEAHCQKCVKSPYAAITLQHFVECLLVAIYEIKFSCWKQRGEPSVL